MKNRLSAEQVKPPVEAPTDHHLLVKKIQINFEDLIVAAIYNKIHILDPKSLKPMEVSKVAMLTEYCRSWDINTAKASLGASTFHKCKRLSSAYLRVTLRYIASWIAIL